MQKYVGVLAKYPARSALAWYLGTIALGALLLSLPISRADAGEGISVIDALFTSTSATCVTGLTVRSTANDFSFFGQLVILVLIQLGGIGILTITTFFALALGSSESLRKTILVTESVGSNASFSLWRLLTVVMLTVFSIEAVGVGLLLLHSGADPARSISTWEAFFHSVSAFCNAGFSLRDDSLVQFRSDPLVNGTIAALIVLGGLGFPVLLDVVRAARQKRSSLWERSHLQTKLMLIGTALLLAVGGASFLALEWNHSLQNEPVGTKLLVACFHSTTTRTAGFFSTDVDSLRTSTLFVTMLLMLVGAGPCSTGGGLKVTSLVVLVTYGWSRFRGRGSASAFRRRISRRSIERAVTNVLLFAAVAAIGLITLLAIEQTPRTQVSGDAAFLETSFEVVSALGTVGLSTGMTPSLSGLGKIVLMVLMLTGRLGPITVVIALSRIEEPSHLAFPKEDVLVG